MRAPRIKPVLGLMLLLLLSSCCLAPAAATRFHTGVERLVFSHADLENLVQQSFSIVGVSR